MKKIDMIGVPMDFGTSNMGACTAPSVYRRSGLVAALEAEGHQVNDLGDLHIPVREEVDIQDDKLKYLDTIVAVTEELSHIVEGSLDKKNIPLCIGGDHALALGSITGVAAHCQKNDLRLGVIWIDAHGDMNTHETTPSGNINGMPFAALMGYGHKKLTELRGFAPKLKAENCSLIGARCIDRFEKDNIKNAKLNTFTSFDIEKNGLLNIVENEIKRLQKTTDFIHVSFDLDVIDPSEAPGVGTPEIGGLRYREASAIIDMLASYKAIQSLDMNELNPIMDVNNMTAEIGIELILSAFGKKIL